MTNDEDRSEASDLAVLPIGGEGYGVELRAWAPSEAAELAAAVTANLEHLRPWMPWVRFEPLALAEREALIRGWEEARRAGGDVVWAIRRDGVVVGGSGLHRRIGPDGLEIGYWVHVDHVGEGIATAAARLATDLAFGVPGIERVEIHHDVTNRASGRVPEKLGFAPAGEVASAREERAPAETGTDRVWRVSRVAWAAPR